MLTTRGRGAAADRKRQEPWSDRQGTARWGARAYVMPIDVPNDEFRWKRSRTGVLVFSSEPGSDTSGSS